MSTGLSIVAFLLLLSLGLGLLRIWRGPGFADRMLAAQLLGTTGIAILLVLAGPLEQPALHDVALVLAMLALLAVLAFVARVWDADEVDPGNEGGGDGDPATGEGRRRRNDAKRRKNHGDA